MRAPFNIAGVVGLWWPGALHSAEEAVSAPRYTIEQYLKVQSATGPSFSPDGQSLTYLSDRSGIAAVWTLDIASGEVRQRTFHAEKVGFARYTGRGDEILFGMDSGGDERQQFHLIDADGRERPLTSDPSAIHVWGALTPDGRRLVYNANTADPAHMRIHVMDLDSGESRLLQDGQGWREVHACSPDGSRVVVQDCRDGMFDMQLSILDIETGEPVPQCPHEGRARYLSPQWAPDASRLYLCTDQGLDFLGVAVLDTRDGSLDWLIQGRWDVEEIALSKDGRTLAYVTNEDGYSRLRIRDLDSGHDQPVPGHAPGVVQSLAWRPDGRALAFTLDGSCSNPDILLWTLDNDRVVPLTVSDTAGIAREHLTEPELVRFSSFDGLEIPGFLYGPAGPVPPGGHPAVILVHGGPEAQYLPQFRADIQHLVDCGYAVLAPNIRGSTGYGNAYRGLDDVRLRPDSVADLRHARLWLGARSDVNSSRIAVSGRSYGGFMVLAAVATYPDLWAAGVEFFGIANWITFFERTGPWRHKLRAVEYGDPEDDAEFLREISPITHVDRIAVPMFVAHGLNDPRVAPYESELIVENLRQRGVPVEYLTFPDEGHGFHKLENRIAVFGAVAEFLERHV